MADNYLKLQLEVNKKDELNDQLTAQLNETKQSAQSSS